MAEGGTMSDFLNIFWSLTMIQIFIPMPYRTPVSPGKGER
jgi:hypothetical protein